MAAVPITLVGLMAAEGGSSFNCTFTGIASLTGLAPEHPIAGPPDRIWGGPGSLPPFPAHPIAPGGSPGVPSHPIVLPGDPSWPGTPPSDLHPEHPIQLPPNVPPEPPPGGTKPPPAGEAGWGYYDGRWGYFPGPGQAQPKSA